MSQISLTANVYFVGPVTRAGEEDATTFYFPCVAYEEFEEDGEEVYGLTECWFIAHDLTEEELGRLKWGDRVIITADVGECGLAASMFQERHGWHVSNIELLSRGNETFEDTDVPIPPTVDLPQRQIPPGEPESVSMVQ